MAARIITYELKNPSDKTDYEAFHKVIRTYDHVVLSDSSYAIATDEYPKDIFEKLFPLIDSEDSLTVIALVRFYMAHHDKAVLQWLDANV
jgi:hypothetical protein